MNRNDLGGQYEVISPWAEVDEVLLKGISPRIADLTGKAIGLFVNSKIAASPIQNMVEKKLHERFPKLEFRRFLFPAGFDVTETKDKAKFEEWAKGIDAAVSAVGD